MDGIFEQKRFAVLVDGDNAQPIHLNQVLFEVAKYGRITIKRIYGDWTTPSMKGWREALIESAMQPVQQFRNTVGKNATDSAMIIDAIDVLNRRLVDGFCIVSSDSDFTRLATRIREDGLFVLGVGENKTPSAFVKACDVFVYTENLTKGGKVTPSPPPGPNPVKVTAKNKPETQAAGSKAIPAETKTALKNLVKQGFAANTSSDGWVNLSNFGNTLRSLDPAFDPRTYGQTKLSNLVESLSDVLEIRHDEAQFPPVIYIRLRSAD